MEKKGERAWINCDPTKQSVSEDVAAVIITVLLIAGIFFSLVIASGRF